MLSYMTKLKILHKRILNLKRLNEYLRLKKIIYSTYIKAFSSEKQHENVHSLSKS